MFIPKHFQEEDNDKLTDFIAQYPFATIVSHTASGIEANHIPLYLEQHNDKKILLGHIAKGNPLWKNLQSSEESLVIFNGPNCYVSPNYYPSKQEHGRAVPTWNYQVVHAKGCIHCFHDDARKLEVVNHLTNLHEIEQKTPWSVSDAPSIYIEKMLSAIVGVEIEVTSLVGKWKVSQNQSENNQQGVIKGLSLEADANSQKMAEIVNINKSSC